MTVAVKVGWLVEKKAYELVEWLVFCWVVVLVDPLVLYLAEKSGN